MVNPDLYKNVIKKQVVEEKIIKKINIISLFLMIITFFLAGIFPISSFCLETIGQFDIEIPIVKNPKLGSGPIGTPAAQNELIQQAFKDMLIRVTGKEKIIESVPVNNAIQRMDDYVRKFSYYQSTEGRVLRVQFNEILVKDLLNQANVKILDKPSQSRGPVLVWAFISENNSQRWIGSEGEKATAEELNRISKKLGMSIVFPLFDINENNQVSEQNIINHEFGPVIEASKRYNASTILVGKLSKQNAGWHAEWTLIDRMDTDKAKIEGDQDVNKMNKNSGEMSKNKSNHNETWDNTQTEFNSLISDSIEKLNEKLFELSESKENNNEKNNLENEYSDDLLLELQDEDDGLVKPIKPVKTLYPSSKSTRSHSRRIGEIW